MAIKAFIRQSLNRPHIARPRKRPISYPLCRSLTVDGRTRLSNIWLPIDNVEDPRRWSQDGHGLLVRGGLLRQAHSGIFHMLPLGLRAQEKLERLIEKHMNRIGASRLSLSSISSEELWTRSGRLQSSNGELIVVKDRKKSGFLLSPTHEEEITSLVAPFLNSYKNLPLRLYQITRKYRDELRPRQGLLRTKEFLMKDLYTFDQSKDAALETYDQVRGAYRSFFSELGLPFLIAEADSGNMGGKLSHEYHFESQLGEDVVWSCNSCTYTANDEVVESRLPEQSQHVDQRVSIWRGVSKDSTSAIFIACPAGTESESHEAGAGLLNMQAVKRLAPAVDTSSIQKSDTDSKDAMTINFSILLDPRLSKGAVLKLPIFNSQPGARNMVIDANTALTRTQNGNPCPRCSSGSLRAHRTIEVGHTFHLGTRYSVPLDVKFTPSDPKLSPQPVEMGCHGIGVSRLIGAIASTQTRPTGQNSPAFGLNWPLSIAPFAIAIIPSKLEKQSTDAEMVYDLVDRHFTGVEGPLFPKDVILDDRDRPFVKKLKDVDVIGYPISILLGRKWATERVVEVKDSIRGNVEEVKLDSLLGSLQRIFGPL